VTECQRRRLYVCVRACMCVCVRACVCVCVCVIVGDGVMSSEPERGCQLIGSAIWCLACHNDVIIAGCRNGSIEVSLLLLFHSSYDSAAVAAVLWLSVFGRCPGVQNGMWIHLTPEDLSTVLNYHVQLAEKCQCMKQNESSGGELAKYE